MSAEKLLPWAKPLLLSSTLTQATIYVLRPMITYRAIELDANAAQVGLIAAVYALFPVLLALQFGSLVGKLGEAKFVIYGTVAMMLTSLALIFSDSLITLGIATAAAGIAHLACMVGGQSMVALRAPRESYDRYFGFYTFSASVGHMLGPIIASVVAGSNGTLPKSTSNAFLLGVVLTIIALVPVIRWRNEKPTVEGKQNSEGTFKAAVSLVKRPGIMAAIYISLAISSVADVLVVATFCEIVKSRVVLTEMIPVESRPLYVLAPAVTEPIVKLALFTIVIAPIEAPDAIVDKVLPLLESVIALFPTSAKP